MRLSETPLLRVAAVILAQGLAAGLPLPVHADHTAQVRHVEQAHGDHDHVIIQDTERQRPDAVVLAPPTARVILSAPSETITLITEAEPRAPDARPPILQTLPRAPPTLL